MANLTEIVQYDAGVYQIETTDAVAGGSSGKSNAPLKNLANRTAYLKQHVDALEAANYAPTASPTFTGDPKAPTPSLGDNDTSLATTAFVQATLGGLLSKSVAGGVNVTLSAVEAGNGILHFTGVLTANIAVIVPTSPTRAWIVKNATSGAYTLTVKTSAGTGVAVTQGLIAEVYGDGTNVVATQTDFPSVALTGTPTAPTAAPGTNTTQVASTAFVGAAVAAAGGTTLGSTAGAALASSGSAGVAVTAARSDHVHPFPTAANVGAVPASGNSDVTGTVGFKGVTVVSTALGNISGAVAIDMSLGNHFTATATGNVTFTITNPPASGKYGGFDLDLTNGGAYAMSFPASVKWAGGTQPTLTASGVDCMSFPTANGGTTYRGSLWAKDSK